MTCLDIQQLFRPTPVFFFFFFWVVIWKIEFIAFCTLICYQNPTPTWMELLFVVWYIVSDIFVLSDIFIYIFLIKTHSIEIGLRFVKDCIDKLVRTAKNLFRVMMFSKWLNVTAWFQFHDHLLFLLVALDSHVCYRPCIWQFYIDGLVFCLPFPRIGRNSIEQLVILKMRCHLQSVWHTST